MPLYEYICEQDGSTITLLRSMAEADEPVTDPEGRNRMFSRMHSTFQMESPRRFEGGGTPRPGCGCGHGGCGH
ncbi:MAG: zinc ribbon domain-containing protein [Phycisphaerales bacterium]|nr:zinc ribbon domain-containing protein [Phycisphaerales bacterium]